MPSFDQKLDMFQKPALTVPTKNDQNHLGNLKYYRLDLDSACLKTPGRLFIMIKILLDESSFGTNFELSSHIYCVMSKLNTCSNTGN